MDDTILDGLKDGGLPQTPIEKTDFQREQEIKEANELSELSELAKSKAWQRLNEVLEKDIEDLERFRNLDITKDLSEVGKEVIIHKAVAERMRVFKEYINRFSADQPEQSFEEFFNGREER